MTVYNDEASQYLLYLDITKANQKMTSNNKLHKQLELTSEQTSPLFRIMWIQNRDEPHRRHFENNICAFHIGNGFILSVAHNLKVEANIFKSIDNVIYLTSIFPYLNSEQAMPISPTRMIIKALSAF